MKTFIYVLATLSLPLLENFPRAMELSDIVNLTRAGEELIYSYSGKGLLIIQTEYTDYGRDLLLAPFKEKQSLGGKAEEVVLGKGAKIYLYFKGREVGWRKQTSFSRRDGRIWIVDERTIFDGEKTMVQSLSRFNREIPTPYGLISSGHPMQLHFIDPRSWGYVVFLPEPVIRPPVAIGLIELLQGKAPDEREVKILGMEDVDDSKCYVVEANFVTCELRLWIDPKKNFMLSKSLGQSKEGIVSESKVIYKRYKDIWFPKEKLSWLYSLDKVTGEKKLISKRSERLSDDFQLNIELPDSLFKAPFVKGEKVYDARINKYIAWPGE